MLMDLAGRPRPVGHVLRARTWHVEKLNYERKIRAYIELWHDATYAFYVYDLYYNYVTVNIK